MFQSFFLCSAATDQNAPIDWMATCLRHVDFNVGCASVRDYCVDPVQVGRSYGELGRFIAIQCKSINELTYQESDVKISVHAPHHGGEMIGIDTERSTSRNC